MLNRQICFQTDIARICETIYKKKTTKNEDVDMLEIGRVKYGEINKGAASSHNARIHRIHGPHRGNVGTKTTFAGI